MKQQITLDEIKPGDIVEYKHDLSRTSTTGTFQHFHKSDDEQVRLIVLSHRTNIEISIPEKEVISITRPTDKAERSTHSDATDREN